MVTDTHVKHLVIIGNGITGVTVARNVRKRSDMRITIISGESRHFYSRPALMYLFMGHMKYDNMKPYENWFWEKNRIDLVYDHATAIDTDKKSVSLRGGATMKYDVLVIATGSETNKFGWPGQDLPGVQGLYSLQDVELLEENVRGATRAVIVGGGLIGIELAEMLRSRRVPVTILVREDLYWSNILPREDATLVSRHILEHGFDLKLGTQLKEILPGPDGRVRALVTDQGEEIACQLVGLTPGVHPNIDLVKGTAIQTGRGVLVNEYLETNLPEVFAGGDCTEIRAAEEGGRNRIEQLWYTGRMQGEVIAGNILGDRKKYDRGIWFNSAKFLDIEYQTYGFVSNVPRPGEESFVWQHQSGKLALHIVYSSATRAIVGLNVFGIRLRQNVCELWIKEGRSLEYALGHLSEANFDPEFYRRYEQGVIDYYNRTNPSTAITPKRKKMFSLFS